MIKDSVAFAIIILIGLEKHRLLPICMQAMYNFTCVNDFYPNMDRLTRIIISLPALPAYDPTIVVLRCLRNCARFEELRPRMVEEGALNVFPVIMSSFDTKDQKEELAFYILTIFRSFAAEKAVRTDMVSTSKRNTYHLIYIYIYILTLMLFLHLFIYESNEMKQTFFYVLHVCS